ncbi:MAG: DUF5715 family protein [Prevotella sp.]|nr:DUF5715 family protein [Prevotella sp.]MDY4040090.1 DUF5715 family protein [Prevotella sp.]
MKITKTRYIQGFGIVVVLLGIVRCAFPSIAEDKGGDRPKPAGTVSQTVTVQHSDSARAVTTDDGSRLQEGQKQPLPQRAVAGPSMFFKADGSEVKNRIMSVPNFGRAFPDQNDVQLAAATKHGVKPVVDRQEAESRKAELVFVGSNPYFYVDRLRRSIPYLVPPAAILLQDIGRSFFDSLQTKAVPLHKIIVTSVMRSKEDVEKLRGHNGNATQNSCHLYGTTFDICYNRYKTVEDPEGPKRRVVRNDTLKWILSEVLDDMRRQGRCYVKYEVHQGCFHITVK